MRRYWFITLLATLLAMFALGLLTARPARAAGNTPPAAGARQSTQYLCVSRLVWRHRELCPSFGPGTTAYRLASIKLPDPLPELPVEEFEFSEGDVLTYTYVYLNALPAPVYHHPMELAMGLPPYHTFLSGDQWVTVSGTVEYEGQQWYQLNADAYMPAQHGVVGRYSRFQGVLLTEQPAYSFAWINQPIQPSLVPQGAENLNAPRLERYQLVTIYGEDRRGDELWYLIGADQWINQVTVAKVTLDPVPEGIPAGDRWIEVDLFEQTLAAYEGERMVFATLVSSGRSRTPTSEGIFRVWGKLIFTPMMNPDSEDGKEDWYNLERVPWTMYFDGDAGLHGAYWHNSFGFTRSHGCVNLAPLDAHWLFNWTTPVVPQGWNAAYDLDGVEGTWVWTHFSSPLEP